MDRPHGDRFRVLFPVEGEVMASERGERGWYLKVRPAATFRTDHLLRGSEVTAWMSKEIERLQLAMGTALADGGTLVEDPPSTLTSAPECSSRAKAGIPAPQSMSHLRAL